jgi:NAD(P)H-nitrite reductase large subunit
MKYSDSIIICRCEEVTYGQIQSTVEEHQCSARELKLRTRAGMGFCGGRMCRPSLDRIIESVIPNTDSTTTHLKYQAPIRPITFGIAGEKK